VQDVKRQADRRAPLPASALCASAVVDEELKWFFERALSEIELPSSFGQVARSAIVGRAGRRTRGLGRPIDDGALRRIEALEAARRIHGWLTLLAPRDREVLTAMYASADGEADGEGGARVDAGSVARALAAYERTRRGASVVPDKEEEERDETTSR